MSRELNDFIIRLGGNLSDEEKTSRDTKLGPLPPEKIQTENKIPVPPTAEEIVAQTQEQTKEAAKSDEQRQAEQAEREALETAKTPAQKAATERQAEQKRKAKIKLDPEHVVRVPKSVRRAGSGEVVGQIMKDNGEDSAEEQRLKTLLQTAEKNRKDYSLVIATRIKPEIAQLEQDIIELKKTLEAKGGPADLQKIIVEKLQQKREKLQGELTDLATLEANLEAAHQTKIAAGLKLRAYQRAVSTPTKIRDRIKPKLIELARAEKEKTKELTDAIVELPEDVIAGMAEFIIDKSTEEIADMLLSNRESGPTAVEVAVGNAALAVNEQARGVVGQIPEEQRVRGEMTKKIEPPIKIDIAPAEHRAQLIKQLREEPIADPILNKWIIITALDNGLISEQETKTALGVLLTLTDWRTRLENFSRRVTNVSEKVSRVSGVPVELLVRIASRLPTRRQYLPPPFKTYYSPQLNRRATVLEWLKAGEPEMEKLQSADERASQTNNSLVTSKKDQLQLLQRRQNWMLTKGRMKREVKHEAEAHVERPHYRHSWYRHNGAAERVDHLAEKIKERLKEWWNREKGGAMGKIIDESRECANELPQLAKIAGDVAKIEIFLGGRENFLAQTFEEIFNAKLPDLIAKINDISKRGNSSAKNYEAIIAKLANEQAEADKLNGIFKTANKSAGAATAELSALLPPPPQPGFFAKLGKMLRNLSPKSRAIEAVLAPTTEQTPKDAEKITVTRTQAEELAAQAAEAKAAAEKQNAAVKKLQTELQQAQTEQDNVRIEYKKAIFFSNDGKDKFYQALIEQSAEFLVEKSEELSEQTARQLEVIAKKERAVRRVYEVVKKKLEEAAKRLKEIQNPKMLKEISVATAESPTFKKLVRWDEEKDKLLEKIFQLAANRQEINQKTLFGEPEKAEPDATAPSDDDRLFEPDREETQLTPRTIAKRAEQAKRAKQRAQEARIEPELTIEQTTMREAQKIAKEIFDISKLLIDECEADVINFDHPSIKERILYLSRLRDDAVRLSNDTDPILKDILLKIRECIYAIQGRVDRTMAEIKKAEEALKRYEQSDDGSIHGPIQRIIDAFQESVKWGKLAIERLNNAGGIGNTDGRTLPAQTEKTPPPTLEARVGTNLTETEEKSQDNYERVKELGEQIWRESRILIGLIEKEDILIGGDPARENNLDNFPNLFEKLDRLTTTTDRSNNIEQLILIAARADIRDLINAIDKKINRIGEAKRKAEERLAQETQQLKAQNERHGSEETSSLQAQINFYQGQINYFNNLVRKKLETFIEEETGNIY